MKLFMTTSECAAVADVSGRHIRNLVSRGELKGVRVGRALRIPTTDFAKFLGIDVEQISEALREARC